MADITGSNEHDPIGRVVVLEDTNGDGRMDKRTVFADGLVLARSIKVLDRGVLVAEPPNVWLMRDTNGDLRMDTKELVTDQYGRFDGDPQNNANGFYWALDNRMYTAGQSDIQLRLKDGVFEVQKTLQRGEWGVSQDDARPDLPQHERIGAARRPGADAVLRAEPEPAAHARQLRARSPTTIPSSTPSGRCGPNPGTNRAYQTGIDRADGSLAKFTSVCAPLVYRGDRLPAELYGNVFVAEPAANLVSRIVLDATTGRRCGRGKRTTAASSSRRPTSASGPSTSRMRRTARCTSPTCTAASSSTASRVTDVPARSDHSRASSTARPASAASTGSCTTRRRAIRVRSLANALPSATGRDALSHPNGWRRDTAQRLLVERGVAIGRAGSSSKLADIGAGLATRVCTRCGPSMASTRSSLPTVVKALEDRVARRARLGDSNRRALAGRGEHPMQAAVLKRMDDPDWAVHQQLAASIGALPPGARETAAVSVLERYGNDPVVMDAALSGLRGSEAIVLDRLLASKQPNEP